MMEKNRLESTASHRSRVSSVVCLQPVYGSWSSWVVGHLVASRSDHTEPDRAHDALLPRLLVTEFQVTSSDPPVKLEARERHTHEGAVMSLPSLDVMRRLVLQRGSSVLPPG